MSLITGHGAPTIYTVASAGELYCDIDTSTNYICYEVYHQTSNLIRDVKTEYRWKHYSDDPLYVFEDEAGNEFYATYADNVALVTAGSNDIRYGMTAVTEGGITVGEKDIPAYHTTEGIQVVPVGEEFRIRIRNANRYDYTKLQAIICAFNTSLDDSVSADKVCINNKVYSVGDTTPLATVSLDHENKEIVLGITNNSEVPFVIRYFSYKEEP